MKKLNKITRTIILIIQRIFSLPVVIMFIIVLAFKWIVSYLLFGGEISIKINEFKEFNEFNELEKGGKL